MIYANRCTFRQHCTQLSGQADYHCQSVEAHGGSQRKRWRVSGGIALITARGAGISLLGPGYWQLARRLVMIIWAVLHHFIVNLSANLTTTVLHGSVRRGTRSLSQLHYEVQCTTVHTSTSTCYCFPDSASVRSLSEHPSLGQTSRITRRSRSGCVKFLGIPWTGHTCACQCRNPSCMSYGSRTPSPGIL